MDELKGLLEATGRMLANAGGNPNTAQEDFCKIKITKPLARKRGRSHFVPNAKDVILEGDFEEKSIEELIRGT